MAHSRPGAGPAQHTRAAGRRERVRRHGDLGGRDRRLADKTGPPPFRYRDRGLLATVGRKTAVIAFGRLRLKGWFAWWIWGIAHIYFLISLRNRLIVMTQWLWSYVSFERGARLITGMRTKSEFCE